MMKFLAAAAMVLVVAAANVGHAGSSTCFNDCMSTCERTGSLARECQIECTQECPVQTPPPTCTTSTDCSAHDSCVANDTAWLLFCTPFPFGPYCAKLYFSPGGVNACPACVTTTVC